MIMKYQDVLTVHKDDLRNKESLLYFYVKNTHNESLISVAQRALLGDMINRFTIIYITFDGKKFDYTVDREITKQCFNYFEGDNESVATFFEHCGYGDLLRDNNVTPLDFPESDLYKSATNKLTSQRVSFEEVCENMVVTHKQKNADYGDSFHRTFEEFGPIAGVVRLNDKLMRVNNLIKGNKQQVKNESIKDTILDMANYSVMLYMEIVNKEAKEANK